MKEDTTWIQEIPQSTTLETVERALILRALTTCNGNRMHAAEMLGVSLRTVRNKINKLKAAGIFVTPPRGVRARNRHR